MCGFLTSYRKDFTTRVQGILRVHLLKLGPVNEEGPRIENNRGKTGRCSALALETYVKAVSQGGLLLAHRRVREKGALGTSSYCPHCSLVASLVGSLRVRRSFPVGEERGKRKAWVCSQEGELELGFFKF